MKGCLFKKREKKENIAAKVNIMKMKMKNLVVIIIMKKKMMMVILNLVKARSIKKSELNAKHKKMFQTEKTVILCNLEKIVTK